MGKKIALTKLRNCLIPADPETEEWLTKLKQGEYLIVDATRPRNPQFHKKFMSLLHFGFDNCPTPTCIPEQLKAAHLPQGVVPEKDFEEWRKDVTILCGYYKVVWRADGKSFRIVAKSISFANMSEDEFQTLYQKAITVLINKAFEGKVSEKEMNNMVNQYLSFT